MARNAAFGRPQAHDRLRLWWSGTSRQARSNVVIAVAVGAAVVALLLAATSHDATGPKPLAVATRQGLTPGPSLTAPSTVVIGGLQSGSSAPAGAENPGLPGPTTTSTVTVAPTTPPVSPVVRTAAPATATTVAPATPRSPATTVPTSDVIFTEVPGPAPTTTTPVTIPPVAKTAPPTTAAPPTSVPPPTTTPPVFPLPLPLPLLGSG